MGGKSCGIGCGGVVVPGAGVGRLLPGIGFGLGGEPQPRADVRRSGGAGALTVEGSCFKLAAVQATEDVGFVADLQRDEDGLAHGFELRVAAVRHGCDGLSGVGDPGGFAVGGGGAGAAGVFLAKCGGRAGGEDAEVASQPRLGTGSQVFAEGTGPVIEGRGELMGERRGGGGGALRPGRAMPQVGQRELLQAVVQDAGDGPGLVHRRGGDGVDQSAEVVPGELGGAEPLVQDPTGVLAVVPPGFMLGEPGLDLLVDVGVQGLPDGGGPQGEQVAGPAGPVLGLADLLGGGQVAVVAAHDGGEDGFGGGLLIGLVAGWRGGAGYDVGGVGLAAAGHADIQGLPGQALRHEEMGGVDGAALRDMDVARVGELGAGSEVGPGDPECPGPGAVEALPPDFGVRASEASDPEGVAVGEGAAASIDLGVEAGADQVANAGVVAVRQRSLRRADGAELGELGLDAAG